MTVPYAGFQLYTWHERRPLAHQPGQGLDPNGSFLRSVPQPYAADTNPARPDALPPSAWIYTGQRPFIPFTWAPPDSPKRPLCTGPRQTQRTDRTSPVPVC